MDFYSPLIIFQLRHGDDTTEALRWRPDSPEGFENEFLNRVMLLVLAAGVAAVPADEVIVRILKPARE